MKTKYRKYKNFLKKYSEGYEIDYSLDEIREMIYEEYDNNNLTGEEFDDLLELLEEIDEY